MDFTNETIGWIAGENGSMIKTEDGGKTWFALPLDSSWQFDMINFVNDSVGWAIGWEKNKGKMIFKTEDGGWTWDIKHENIENYLNAIYAGSDSFACYVGYATIFKTEDSGNVWTDITPDFECELFSIWFWDPNIGIATGSYNENEEVKSVIFRTEDGGESWEEVIFPELEKIFDLQFLDDSTGYFLAAEDIWDGPYYIYETGNGGRSWTVKMKRDYRIQSFYFLNPDTIYATISDPQNFQNLMYSTDGGMTWEKKRSLYDWYLNQIIVDKNNTGHILATKINWEYFRRYFGPMSGSLYLNNNNENREWRIKRIWAHLFTDLHFFDENTGFVAGGSHGFHFSLGEIFATSDGGESWTQSLAGCPKLKSIDFLDPLTGFALTLNKNYAESKIYKTFNGGKNWVKMFDGARNASADFIFDGYDLRYVNEKTVWVVGFGDSSTSWRGATILNSKDTGVQWNIAWKDITAGSLYSVDFLDEYRAWAVGEQGLIVKFNQQDQWQKQEAITDLPLLKVFFIDEDNGWISGGYTNEIEHHPILFKTINGGDSWAEILDVNFLINDIYFETNLHGWAVGADADSRGIIAETIDGGEHWTIQIENLLTPLLSIFMKDNFGWAVGGGWWEDRYVGVVLKTLDSGSTWIEEYNDQVYANRFKLSQNYPNPFNPITIINYELQFTNYVYLSIYNLLGQKVATLVSERQAAGYHQVEWDASSFSSGIYYYRLEVGEFREVKKMVLLR